MLEYSTNDLAHLSEHGWLIKENFIPSEKLNAYSEIVNQITQNINTASLPLRRTYQPHLRSHNFACIDYCLNKAVASDAFLSMISELRIGEHVSRLLSWESPPRLEIARVFTMKGYNYRSLWHRDANQKQLHEANSILVGVFFKRQKGFRIFKKKFDKYEQSLNFDLQRASSNHDISVQPHMFHTLDCPPGSILFFDPSLMHQGNSNSPRSDLHFSFSKQVDTASKHLTGQFDFTTKDNLHPDFDLTGVLPAFRKKSNTERLIGSINYYLPYRNFRRNIRLKAQGILPSFCDIDWFANTAFQRH